MMGLLAWSPFVTFWWPHFRPGVVYLGKYRALFSPYISRIISGWWLNYTPLSCELKWPCEKPTSLLLCPLYLFDFSLPFDILWILFICLVFCLSRQLQEKFHERREIVYSRHTVGLQCCMYWYLCARHWAVWVTCLPSFIPHNYPFSWTVTIPTL